MAKIAFNHVLRRYPTLYGNRTEYHTYVQNVDSIWPNKNGGYTVRTDGGWLQDSFTMAVSKENGERLLRGESLDLREFK
jgi:hypothetical protein